MKTSEIIIMIIIIIAIFYLIYVDSVTRNIVLPTHKIIETPITEEKINLCDTFKNAYGTYLMLASYQCTQSTGTYLCNEIKVGCYSANLDSSLCETQEIKNIETSCNNLKGIWTCNSNQFSCEVS